MADKYPSRYSPNKFVTPAQFIIEFVCERNAAQRNADLPIQFWKLPEWATFYKSQLRKCHSLLKVYSSEAIIKALKDQRAAKIYSLFAPWLIDIIKIYQAEIDKPIKKQDNVELIGSNFERKDFKKTNIIDILNE